MKRLRGLALAAFLLTPLVTAAVVTAQDLTPETTPAPDNLTAPESARLLIGDAEGRPLVGAELEAVTEDVASRMRCPVCQGLSVADSPTPTALAMREEVRDLLAAGYDRDQVMAFFERSYGEFIRLEPKPEGFNLLAWILPVLALVAGALALFGRRGRGAAGVPAEREDDGSSQDGSIRDGSTRDGADAPESEGLPGAGIDPDLEPYLERVRREVGA